MILAENDLSQDKTPICPIKAAWFEFPRLKSSPQTAIMPEKRVRFQVFRCQVIPISLPPHLTPEP